MNYKFNIPVCKQTDNTDVEYNFFDRCMGNYIDNYKNNRTKITLISRTIDYKIFGIALTKIYEQ